MGGVFCMELPKNIVQIGEMNPHCKIYIEDYAVSFLKQLNKASVDKNTAAALYGHMEKEGDKTVIFIYCAAKLDMLEREVRHLSQAQLQEIDRISKRYFPEFDFIGYKMLNGEMIEGMHICEQGICRYMEGYAQFYEKNDSMLAYMLDYKGGVVSPEVVNREKYDVVRKRQEERKLINDAKKQDKKQDKRKNARHVRTNTADNLTEAEEYETLDEMTDGMKNEIKSENNASAGKLKNRTLPVAAALLLLCVWGMVNSNDSSMNNFKESVNGLVNNIAGKNIQEDVPVSGKADTLVAEDKLVDAVMSENDIKENDIKEPDTEQPQTVQNDESQANSQINSETNTVLNTEQNVAQSVSDTPESMPETKDEIAASVEETTQTAATTVSYTIKKGDTLLGISLKQYGNANQIKAICSMNGIDDPDDIKVGQKILLP
jgi:LysM repeat protein